MQQITSIANECLPIIADLRKSLEILTDCYHANQSQINIMYSNAENICEYSLNYFHVHRTEHMKVAGTMLYIHNEFFKWVCNELAEDIADFKLQNPKEEYELSLDIPYLNSEEIKYAHNQIFKNIKPDNWVEDLEARLRNESKNT